MGREREGTREMGERENQREREIKSKRREWGGIKSERWGRESDKERGDKGESKRKRDRERAKSSERDGNGERE
jgi:hypothetical protein